MLPFVTVTAGEMARRLGIPVDHIHQAADIDVLAGKPQPWVHGPSGVRVALSDKAEEWCEAHGLGEETTVCQS